MLSKSGVPQDEMGDFCRASGQLFQLLNRHQEALAFYSKALPLTSGLERQKLAMSIAQSFLALQQPDKARQILTRELHTTPWNGPQLMLQSLK